MILKVSFNPQTLNVTFNAQNATITTSSQIVKEYVGAPDYDGAYDVIPMAWEGQTLPTAMKLLRENVTVQEIPYYEVSNQSGGVTVNIG